MNKITIGVQNGGIKAPHLNHLGGSVSGFCISRIYYTSEYQSRLRSPAMPLYEGGRQYVISISICKTKLKRMRVSQRVGYFTYILFTAC